MNNQRKLISICYLDLLYELAVETRFIASNDKRMDYDRYLKAIVRALEYAKEASEIEAVWPLSISAKEDWCRFLCKVFNVNRLENEGLMSRLFYYPFPVSVAEDDYKVLIVLFGKTKTLFENSEKMKIAAYMDMIHVIPATFKDCSINRRVFLSGYFLPFVKENLDFMSIQEIAFMKKWSRGE